MNIPKALRDGGRLPSSLLIHTGPFSEPQTPRDIEATKRWCPILLYARGQDDWDELLDAFKEHDNGLLVLPARGWPDEEPHFTAYIHGDSRLESDQGPLRCKVNLALVAFGDRTDHLLRLCLVNGLI